MCFLKSLIYCLSVMVILSFYEIFDRKLVDNGTTQRIWAVMNQLISLLSNHLESWNLLFIFIRHWTMRVVTNIL